MDKSTRRRAVAFLVALAGGCFLYWVVVRVDLEPFLRRLALRVVRLR